MRGYVLPFLDDHGADKALVTLNLQPRTDVAFGYNPTQVICVQLDDCRV